MILLPHYDGLGDEAVLLEDKWKLYRRVEDSIREMFFVILVMGSKSPGKCQSGRRWKFVVDEE